MEKARNAGRGVIPLFSPPCWPPYNGAVAAGIGALKDRTECRAGRAGHPGQWTWDDVATARLEANATARPRGLDQPTPDERWQRRGLVTTGERAAFQANVQRYREELGREEEHELGRQETNAMERRQRQAIQRALAEGGTRWGRVSDRAWLWLAMNPAGEAVGDGRLAPGDQAWFVGVGEVGVAGKDADGVAVLSAGAAGDGAVVEPDVAAKGGVVLGHGDGGGVGDIAH